MSQKLPSIPGFETLSKMVLVREAGPEAPPPDHPELILLFGWGDCLPKHIAKFSAGYLALYPHTKQFVLLGPIWDSLMLSVNDRIDSMRPLVEALRYPDLAAAGNPRPRVLAQAMSNTGAGNYAVTLNGFRQRHGLPLPHDLLVLDSTPGSPYMTPRTLAQWSRAMTVGTASWFPWPAFVTQGIWGTFLVATRLWGNLIGHEFPGVYAVRIVEDEDYETKDAKRLYMYSKEDDVIAYQDIEGYAAGSAAKGWGVRTELFEGTGHVGHMRQHPEQYWKAVADAWTWAVKDRQAREAEAESKA